MQQNAQFNERAMRRVQNPCKEHPAIREGQHDDSEGADRQQEQDPHRILAPRLPNPFEEQPIKLRLGIDLKQHLSIIAIKIEQEQPLCAINLLVPFHQDIDQRIFLGIA